MFSAWDQELMFVHPGAQRRVALAFNVRTLETETARPYSTTNSTTTTSTPTPTTTTRPGIYCEAEEKVCLSQKPRRLPELHSWKTKHKLLIFCPSGSDVVSRRLVLVAYEGQYFTISDTDSL